MSIEATLRGDPGSVFMVTSQRLNELTILNISFSVLSHLGSFCLDHRDIIQLLRHQFWKVFMILKKIRNTFTGIIYM